jgi:hypothetical protein
MKQALIDYPESLPGILKVSEADLIGEFRFILAGKLYELGKLTSGKAAEMARISRVDFLGRLSRYGFNAINLTDEQIEKEIEAAEAASR